MPEELYGIYDNIWNTPTFKNPVYSIESTHNKTTNVSGYNLLIAGLDTVSGFLYELVEDLYVKIFYTKSLDNLELYTATSPNSDLENIIPNIFEELVILYSELVMLRQSDKQAMLQSVYSDIQTTLSSLKDNYNIGLGINDILIPTKE
jgi:hypothetical protein